MLKRTKKTVTTKTKQPRTKRSLVLPSEEIHKLIQKRAYELYCKRPKNSGDHMKDWLIAEREVRKEVSAAS